MNRVCTGGDGVKVLPCSLIPLMSGADGAVSEVDWCGCGVRVFFFEDLSKKVFHVRTHTEVIFRFISVGVIESCCRDFLGHYVSRTQAHAHSVLFHFISEQYFVAIVKLIAPVWIGNIDLIGVP